MIQGKDPNMGTLAQFAVDDDSKPIAIANLLKFHELAIYPAGVAEIEAGLTGRQAYKIYAESFLERIVRLGGRSLYWGDSKACFIGESDWDAVWVNYFPSFAVLQEATRGPEFDEMNRHRAAGLDHQVAIATKPLIP
jgi:uncharacterized protein (DUF1330 family)